MTTIDRRHFLGLTPLAAAGLAQPSFAGAQSSVPTAPESADVRMTGDGLSLTPAEHAALWTRLADAGIARDAYSNGGAVERLEEAFARVLGKERAVFMPTGTLANHLAVRTLAEGNGRAVVQADSHLYNDSGDCVQTLSNIPLVPLAAGRPSFTLDELAVAVERTAGGRVTTRVSVISIETPVRRQSGATFDRGELEKIVAFARREGIRLHLDGARIFLQAAYDGRDVADYCAPFDTVYVSLYKYFNAPSGAILAGPRDLLDPMYHTRRMFGAGLPAAWPFAVIAHHYLSGFTDRFRTAVEMSEAWIDRIAHHDAFEVERIPQGTNLCRLRVRTGDPEAFRQQLRDGGIAIGAPRANGDGTASVLVAVNETWNGADADALVAAFTAAVEA